MPKQTGFLRQAWVHIREMSPLQWVNLVAAIATLFGVPIALFTALGKLDPTWVGRGFALFVCSAGSLFLVLLAVEEFRWHRKARYAEALEALHQVHESIRDAWCAYTLTGNIAAVHDDLQRGLRSFAGAFSLITGVHCRACIKQLTIHDEKAQTTERGLITRTICRSEDPADPALDSTTDWLSENSDFLTLFRTPNKKWFLGQNLVAMLRQGYRNSHWTEDVIKDERFSYRGAVVWPIRKRFRREDKSPRMHPDQDIFGFLCVDTMSRNVFRERYDFAVGAAVADELYPLLTTLYRDQQAASAARPTVGAQGGSPSAH